MKKISAFLAGVMFFLAVAVVPAGIQKVQAFPISEYPTESYESYLSTKAGSKVSIYTIDKDADKAKYDGAKVGLCPENGKAMADLKVGDAIVSWDISDDDLKYNSEGKVDGIYKKIIFSSDVPEKQYNFVLFNSEGNYLDTAHAGYTNVKYVNKTIASFRLWVMNNDGYVYAYVYEDDISGSTFNETNYPTLYDSDKQTVLTSYDAYTTVINPNTCDRAGEKVLVYRLNVLDTGKLNFGDEVEFAYYKINGDASARFVYDGFGLNSIGNVNKVYDKEVVDSPFDQNETPAAPSDSNTKTDDSQSGDTGNTSTSTPAASTAAVQTTAAPTEPEIVVTPLTDSTVPEIQDSINILKKLVEEISSSPADVVSTLKAYAAGTDFSSVTAGGTLDISVTNGTDISSGKQITFTDDKIAANVTGADQIVVLHVKNDGTIECVPATAGDGCITATFTSLSPVAWFKVSNAEKITATSPKTGESFWSFIMH